MFVIVNKNKTHKQTDSLFSRAKVDAASVIDTENEKSFEVVFATETPVFRRGWEENYNEVLSVVPEHMRLQRLDEKAVPLVDAHSTWTITKQMGRVDSYTIKNKEARAKVIFSTQDEFAGIWKDIKAGIIRNISVQYNVYKYLREIVSDNTIPNYRAIDWEPLEISLVPVPADYKSAIRNNEGNAHDVEIVFQPQKNNRSNMEKETTEVVEQAKPATTATQQRSEQTATTSVVDEAKIRTEAMKAERQRASDIRKAVRAAKLEDSFAEGLVNEGKTIDEARAAIIDKMAEADTTPAVRTSGNAGVVTVDETEKTRTAIGDALLHRSKPGSVKLEDKAHDFKYLSMLDVARHCLTQKGESAARYSPNEVVKRAIATTDYPNILNSTIERAIRRTYDAIPAEWKNIAKQTTAKDFRTKTGIAVDGKVTFEEISEGGEYKNSLLLNDDSATLKLKTFGRKITVTRQAIINDDLEVFSKLPDLIARGANNFQAAKVWGLLTGNAKAPDGTALFHATHGNLAGAGAALSETTLSAARVAMWKQATPAGELMGLSPELLIVPIELLTTAEKLMSGLVTPSDTQNVNVFANKYKIVTSPYLTNATAYYLATNPQSEEGIVYAYLEGEEGLFVDKEVSFDTDAVVTKARLDFDAKVWGYRGWYKNAGV